MTLGDRANGHGQGNSQIKNNLVCIRNVVGARDSEKKPSNFLGCKGEEEMYFQTCKSVNVAYNKSELGHLTVFPVWSAL